MKETHSRRADNIDDRAYNIDNMKAGKYRHFKGGLYELLCTAKHTETLETLVVYRALYGDGEIWVRPAAMWNEIVIHQGKRVKRFTPFGEGENTYE